CSPSVIYIKDLEGRYLRINRQFEKLSGLSSEQVIGKTDFELFPHDVALNATTNDRLALETRKPVELKEFGPVDGNIHTFFSIKYPLVDPEGNLYGVCGISTDINAHEEMELRLKDNEIRYQSLFEKNHSPMLLINPNTGDIVDANTAAVTYYGWDYDELTNKKITEINTLSSRKIHQKMKLASNDEAQQFFFTHRLASGEMRDVEVHSTAIRLKEETLLYSIVHDITDRKRNEALLKQCQTIISQMDDLAFICDPQGNILFANETAQRETGFDIGADIGSPFAALFPPAYADRVSEGRHQALNGKTVRFELSFRDASRPFEFKYLPLKDQENTISGTIILARDITERRKIEVERETINKSLEDQVVRRTKALEEVNAALKVLLDQREKDRVEQEERIHANYELMLQPLMEKMKGMIHDNDTQTYLDLLNSQLQSMTSPFGKALTDPLKKLSPAEIEIAYMIRQGYSNKEIAGLSNRSIHTITNHRKNIRKKLHIANRKQNLRSFLLQFK
ncbi:MAG: PAS domain-containing protein, partial [Desulfobacterales bacterium]|nr:PAS domain-containing protein [Desulfobacterales bacterium]